MRNSLFLHWWKTSKCYQIGKNHLGFHCIVVQRTKINLVLCKMKSSFLRWPSLWEIWEEERKMETWLTVFTSGKGPGFSALCWWRGEVWALRLWANPGRLWFESTWLFWEWGQGETLAEGIPELGCDYPSSLKLVPLLLLGLWGTWTHPFPPGYTPFTVHWTQVFLPTFLCTSISWSTC